MPRLQIGDHTYVLPDPKTAAFFLDRDGVINVDTDYPHRPDQIEWMPGIFEFVAGLTQAGFKIIVVTNQSGIGRGLYSTVDFLALSIWMKAEFLKNEGKITEFFHCPHLPDAGCDCRKPKPGMILTAAAKYKIDLASSWLIGDRSKDIEAANAAGIGTSVGLGIQPMKGPVQPTLQVTSFSGIRFDF